MNKRCAQCGLYKYTNYSKLPIMGNGNKKILLVTETPSISENDTVRYFLKKIFKKYNIDLLNDCWMTSAILCKSNKNHTNKQISLCNYNLHNDIIKLKPNKIILFGKSALQSFLLNRISVASIEKFNGFKIPDQQYNCWVFPIWHPKFVIYEKENIVISNLFHKYVKEAILWDKKFVKENFIPNIILNKNEAILFLKNYNEKYAAIDFETTGLKPYKNGHKIICIGISGKNNTTAFPIFDDSNFLSELKIFLQSNILKIAHNIKFEDVWSTQILKCEIKNWISDTMIDSHLYDNRSGIAGLKFQSYLNFGVSNYNKEIEKLFPLKMEMILTKYKK